MSCGVIVNIIAVNPIFCGACDPWTLHEKSASWASSNLPEPHLVVETAASAGWKKKTAQGYLPVILVIRSIVSSLIKRARPSDLDGQSAASMLCLLAICFSRFASHSESFHSPTTFHVQSLHLRTMILRRLFSWLRPPVHPQMGGQCH